MFRILTANSNKCNLYDWKDICVHRFGESTDSICATFYGH